MDEEIKKYELEKIKLEVTQLEREIYAKKSTNFRGWFAIIITVISIVTGFVGVYNSYWEIRDQYEEERKFSFNADMLEIIKEGDGEKLNLQSLIYFGHNPIPLLISIMEYDGLNREEAIKVILRIYSKQTKDIKSNIQELLVDSFEALGKEVQDYQAFFAYFEILDKLKEELGLDHKERISSVIKSLDFTIAAKENSGEKIGLESLISFDQDAIPLLIPVMQYDVANRKEAINVMLIIYDDQTASDKSAIQELLIQSFIELEISKTRYSTFFAYFETFDKLKMELSNNQKSRIVGKAKDLDATIPIDDFNLLLEKDEISKFIEGFEQ